MMSWEGLLEAAEEFWGEDSIAAWTDSVWSRKTRKIEPTKPLLTQREVCCSLLAGLAG